MTLDRLCVAGDAQTSSVTARSLEGSKGLEGIRLPDR